MSRVGSGHADQIRPARSDVTREKRYGMGGAPPFSATGSEPFAQVTLYLYLTVTKNF